MSSSHSSISKNHDTLGSVYNIINQLLPTYLISLHQLQPLNNSMETSLSNIQRMGLDLPLCN